MAAKKGNTHGFKKGQSGNPSGRKPTPPELKYVEKLTKENVCLTISKYCNMSSFELNILNTDELKAFDVVIVNALRTAAEDGDMQKLEYLLNRAVGKVKDQIDHTVIRPTIIERLNGTQLQLGTLEEGSWEN